MIRFLLVLLTIALALVIGGFLLPTQLTLERSVVVNRPASTTFTLLNGFRTWGAWSPWAELDPNAMLARSGPDTGVGARLSWSGDPALVGAGSQEIVFSEPYARVVLVTDLGGQGPATVTYLVEDGGLGSRVSWRFETELATDPGVLRGLVGRYYGWFLKRWVAEDFDRGLGRFKAFAERLPEWDFAGAPITRFTAEPFPIATITGIEDDEPGAVAAGLAVAFAELATWATTSALPIEGEPLTITRRGADGRDRFEAALPLRETEPVPLAEEAEPLAMPVPPIPAGRITFGEAPSGDAACITHRGAADDTLASYERLFAWLAAHGYRESGVSWERYRLDPATQSNADGNVDICFLIDPDP